MEYENFKSVLNKTTFEKSRANLIKNLAISPERYVGLFRSTNSKTKAIQNLLQSYELKFGSAFEVLIEKYLEENGFEPLDKKLAVIDGRPPLVANQLFARDNTVFLIEQKIRDDHDTHKKKGQIDNFKKKISVVLERHHDKNIEGFLYFVDDGFTRNKEFYTEEIGKLSEEIEKISDHCRLTLHLFYGGELFSELGKSEIWNEILEHLKKWKKDGPDFLNIDFDKDEQVSFNELKQLDTTVYEKLFSNVDLDDLLLALFPDVPNNSTLNLLHEHFEQMYLASEKTIYQTLGASCKETIDRLANHRSYTTESDR